MGMVCQCDICKTIENVRRQFYCTDNVSDGNGGREDEGQYIDLCPTCENRVFSLALKNAIAGNVQCDPHRYGQLFTEAFKSIGGK